jgi:hypothetical protein
LIYTSKLQKGFKQRYSVNPFSRTDLQASWLVFALIEILLPMLCKI